MADDLVGKRIGGRYTVLRLLGQGGMASVYAAERDEAPRTIALKLMNRSLTADPRFVKRFEREAQAASRVRHPNTVQIHDWGVADGFSYIAMELLEGVDLATLLDREGPISQRRAASLVVEICEALVTAHEVGVVHRDLKPENVMILPDPGGRGDRVKVLDFGISKMLFEEGTAEGPPDSDEAPTGLTRTGTQLGTPAYMSPEQCQLLDIDARSDIYTCGILLYQMATGGVPFEGETPLHTATLHVHEPLVRPGTYAPHLDARLEAVIVKALSKKPADRQPSARALADELRALVPLLPEGPARLGGPPRSRKSGPHSPRRSPPPPAAGAPAFPPRPMFGPAAAPMFAGAAGGPRDEDAHDEGDDESRTLMRAPEGDVDDDARTIMREPTPPPRDLTGTPGPRRGTEMLDLRAPIASPSAPSAQPPMYGHAFGPALPMSPPTMPSYELAGPRPRPSGPSGLTALLLGFVAGAVVIGIALFAYALLRR